MKIFRVLLILAFVLLAFSGCRYRVYLNEIITPIAEILPPPEYVQDHPEAPIAPPDDISPEAPPSEPEITPPDTPELPEPPEPLHIPLTYIEAEAVDLSPQTIEIVSEDARQYASEEVESAEAITAAQAYNIADNIVTIEDPAEIEGQAVIGDGGGIIGIVATYSNLLRQGVNTMFPCQLYYIYVETAADFVTVGRGSEIYQLMVNSGGLNVSSRLTDDRLTVTADWVVRRNPDIIVKFVDVAILGSGISSTYAAVAARLALAERPDWGSIEAIRTNRILLLSQQMLETEETQLAIKLAVAHLMYPELFEGIDINGAIAGLMAGMEGIHMLTYKDG